MVTYVHTHPNNTKHNTEGHDFIEIFVDPLRVVELVKDDDIQKCGSTNQLHVFLEGGFVSWPWSHIIFTVQDMVIETRHKGYKARAPGG